MVPVLQQAIKKIRRFFFCCATSRFRLSRLRARWWKWRLSLLILLTGRIYRLLFLFCFPFFTLPKLFYKAFFLISQVRKRWLCSRFVCHLRLSGFSHLRLSVRKRTLSFCVFLALLIPPSDFVVFDSSGDAFTSRSEKLIWNSSTSRRRADFSRCTFVVALARVSLVGLWRRAVSLSLTCGLRS